MSDIESLIIMLKYFLSKKLIHLSDSLCLSMPPIGKSNKYQAYNDANDNKLPIWVRKE